MFLKSSLRADDCGEGSEPVGAGSRLMLAVELAEPFFSAESIKPGRDDRRGLHLIGYAFAALAVYLLIQSTVVLAAGYHPRHSVPGIIWTAVTAAVMFALAGAKAAPAPRSITRCCGPKAGSRTS